MGAAAAEADRTLFVGNLETKVTEELLFELFHQVSGREQAFPFAMRLLYGPARRPCPPSWGKRGCGSGRPMGGPLGAGGPPGN